MPGRVLALPFEPRTDQRPVCLARMPDSVTTLLERVGCVHPDAARMPEGSEFEKLAPPLRH